MKILISGANGFVGSSLQNFLRLNGHQIQTLAHNQSNFSSKYLNYDCFVHLAGRAHVIHENADKAYDLYRSVNVDYTLKTVALAKSLGIKRFIFLSSVKVNGERSLIPFNENDIPHPEDAYGQTKLEAELTLKNYCKKNKIELVIIRPPLIYGQNVKANFRSLVKLCSLPLPLPFSIIKNKRSLISLENLNSFIELCCHHPAAANQTFLISDDHDVSTTELIRSIKTALGRSTFLLPIHSTLLSFAFHIIGKQNLSDRLLNNLQLDITKAKQLLGWKPVISFEAAIKQTVKEYVA